MSEEKKVKRKAIAKRLRFEVLKRDKFACQYCGAKAPDALLHVDHVHPVAAGGGNNVMNLITACQPCNSGKSDRLLGDDTSIQKRRSQVAEVQARKEQIEMMSEWQMSLVDMDQQSVNAARAVVERLIPGWSVADSYMSVLRASVAKYGLESVCSEYRLSSAKNSKMVDGKLTQDSANAILKAAESALKWKAMNEKDPVGANARYVRGILRNRFMHVNEARALDLLTCALNRGVSFEALKQIAVFHTVWTDWQGEMYELLESLETPK